MSTSFRPYGIVCWLHQALLPITTRFSKARPVVPTRSAAGTRVTEREYLSPSFHTPHLRRTLFRLVAELYYVGASAANCLVGKGGREKMWQHGGKHSNHVCTTGQTGREDLKRSVTRSLGYPVPISPYQNASLLSSALPASVPARLLWVGGSNLTRSRFRNKTLSMTNNRSVDQHAHDLFGFGRENTPNYLSKTDVHTSTASMYA